MPSRVEILEPGKAIPENRGYVGVADPGGTLTFPHVDSCCALAYLLDDGHLVGGHLGAQWPGEAKPNYELNGKKVFDLMNANLTGTLKGKGKVLTVVSVGPSNWGTFKQKVVWSTLQPPCTVDVDTSKVAKGVDVTVTAKEITVKSCKSARTRTFAVPQDGYVAETMTD